MRKFFALIAVVCLLGTAATAFAKTVPLPVCPAPTKAQLDNELPARVPTGFARTDTLNFGYFQVIGGQNYAVLGQEWTFDHGAGSLEGWYSVDETANLGDYWKQINGTDWGGHGNLVAAPVITGTGSAWVGIYENDAKLLCWEGGLGYGNNWCQRLTSPEYTYTGSGAVNITFNYFEDSEFKFDYGKVLVAVAGGETLVNGPGGFTGQLGTPPAGPWVNYSGVIDETTMGGPSAPRPFNIVFEFTADGGWSDEDGFYTTNYGPFAVDDVSITGSLSVLPPTYTFDSNLEGWVPSRCAGLGSFMAIHPKSMYTGITFPCSCALSANVLGFHNVDLHHTTGAQETGWAPAANRTTYQAYNQIMADWDQYSDLPEANGTFYRPGWSYYPYLCPASGAYQWSGRKGQDVWNYVSTGVECGRYRNIATDWGVPADCQVIGFVYEVFSSCDAFGIASTLCTGEVGTNASPLIDNVEVRMTGVINAPVVGFDTGDSYTDGFPQTDVLGVMNTGNANIARDLNSPPNANNDPWKLGDSLVVLGPNPTPSTKWDAKLWFRVRREGPGQVHIPAYRTWLGKVADGRQITGPTGAFTFGWMDSVETNTVSRIRCDSYFRENDDDYTAGAQPKPDINANNEIIPDGVLTPGTKIEYFITSNYTCLPTTYYYYPDTVGKSFWEFEILPSYRTDMNDPQHPGWYKFPCVLWVNGSANVIRRGAIERALNMAMTGVSAANSWKIPDPAPWDRYDYQNIGSNFAAPMIRNSGGFNGATVPELLGYKLIIFSTGSSSASGTADYRDWEGLSNWLSATVCNGNTNRQGFWGTGDQFAGIVKNKYPSFLQNDLGVDVACDLYSNGCPAGNPADHQYCVNLVTQGTAAWTPTVTIDLYGNWCPEQFQFDVISPINAGLANKAYGVVGTSTQTHEAQIVCDQSAGANNYRSVVDAYYISRALQTTTPAGDPTECVYDSTRAVIATSDEVNNILKWTLGITNPTLLGLCQDPCLDVNTVPTQAGSELVNRLSQNKPNPFNPSTQISYSLANAGPATLAIFDVNGRRVKTLVNGPLTAGPHMAVWDGLDQAGHKVPAGIYWSQLSTTGYTSNKKMVVVR